MAFTGKFIYVVIPGHDQEEDQEEEDKEATTNLIRFAITQQIPSSGMEP